MTKEDLNNIETLSPLGVLLKGLQTEFLIMVMKEEDCETTYFGKVANHDYRCVNLDVQDDGICLLMNFYGIELKSELIKFEEITVVETHKVLQVNNYHPKE